MKLTNISETLFSEKVLCHLVEVIYGLIYPEEVNGQTIVSQTLVRNGPDNTAPPPKAGLSLKNNQQSMQLKPQQPMQLKPLVIKQEPSPPQAGYLIENQ